MENSQPYKFQKFLGTFIILLHCNGTKCIIIKSNEKNQCVNGAISQNKIVFIEHFDRS
jgi:hypothetical protein